jgi:hypothetical protein
MSKEEISDKEAIEHFKRRILDKFTPKDKERLRVVSIQPKEEFVIEELTFDEIYQHMLEGDEIGQKHLEIEKNWMQEAKRRGLE